MLGGIDPIRPSRSNQSYFDTPSPLCRPDGLSSRFIKAGKTDAPATLAQGAYIEQTPFDPQPLPSMHWEVRTQVPLFGMLQQ